MPKSPRKLPETPIPMRGSVGEIATVRVELVGRKPLIWRQVEVPTSMTLQTLHRVIQAAMGWASYHLWEFTIGGRRYGPPPVDDWDTEPRVDAAKVRLRDVLAPRRTVIEYVYDFGDDWEHRLTVTSVRSGDPALSYPRYVGGERNRPPEDCGGIHPGVIDEFPIKLALGRIAKQRAAAGRGLPRNLRPVRDLAVLAGKRAQQTAQRARCRR